MGWGWYIAELQQLFGVLLSNYQTGLCSGPNITAMLCFRKKKTRTKTTHKQNGAAQFSILKRIDVHIAGSDTGNTSLIYYDKVNELVNYFPSLSTALYPSYLKTMTFSFWLEFPLHLMHLVRQNQRLPITGLFFSNTNKP